MVQIAVNCIAEFDGTGAPTGNVWINGVKYTGCTATHIGAIPPSDGKTTTKITCAVNVEQDSVDLTKFYIFGKFGQGDYNTHTGGWTKA